MSFLLNPSFEEGSTGWSRVNLEHAVSYKILGGVGARSGENVLSVSTTEASGSIAQDVNVPSGVASVSCFAWVRAKNNTQVEGTLALWQLSPSPQRGMPARFTVGPQWQLVTCTVGFSNTGASKRIRAEIYVGTVNQDLYVDSVNAF